MILRKSDFTQEAIDGGVWQVLFEQTQGDDTVDPEIDHDDIDISIEECSIEINR